MASRSTAALAALTLAQVCVLATAGASGPAGDVEAAAAAAYGVYSANPGSSNPGGPVDAAAAQMLSFREATARVLEATHGWINCLLAARPRPPPEIARCTEAALPHVADILMAVTTAGWAIRFKSQDELDGIRRSIQRMSDVRTQVHSCVEGLNPHLQVSGRCYTVL